MLSVMPWTVATWCTQYSWRLYSANVLFLRFTLALGKHLLQYTGLDLQHSCLVLQKMATLGAIIISLCSKGLIKQA